MSADDDKLAELAALYVSGALRAEEQRGFEATLAGSPQARAAVRELEGVLLALTGVAPPEAPPPRIKAELLQTIAATPATVIQRAFDTPWQDTPIAGVQRRVLHVDRERRQLTVLLRMAPARAIPAMCIMAPRNAWSWKATCGSATRCCTKATTSFRRRAVSMRSRPARPAAWPW